MSNEPGTYHLLVTLPDVTGEQADGFAEEFEKQVRAYGHYEATVVHLTPETVPDRYISRARLRTVIHDWTNGGHSATGALLKIRDLLR